MPLFHRHDHAGDPDEPKEAEGADEEATAPAPPHPLPDPTGGHAVVAARLLAAAPEVGARLVASLLPAVRFAVQPRPDFDIGVGWSKFGGSPDLPHGATWPTWTNPAGHERPLNFFAQVNLATTTHLAEPAALDLPSDGLLSFFADFDLSDQGITGLHPWERDGSLVLHTPAETPLSRHPNEVAPLQPAALAPFEVWTWSHELVMSPDVSDAEFDAIEQLEATYEAELAQRVHAGWMVDGRHQLGGHANFIQRPVAEQVVQALAGCFEHGFDQARWEAAMAQVPEWRLLLQIDSDKDLDVMWGDVGTIYWAARQADIDADAFDQGMFDFQSS